MSKVRLSNRSKKVLLVLLYCLLPLFFTLILFCKDNYEIAHRRVGRYSSYVSPTDLDVYWYVIGGDSNSNNLIGLTTEDIKQYEYNEMIAGRNDYILENKAKSSIDQTLSLAVPYRLHVTHCEMHNKENIKDGLDITIDSFMDSEGNTHDYDCVLMSVRGYGDAEIMQMCYDKYVSSKYGESSVPFFKYFRYMPAIHEDTYIEHYRLWSEFWPYARVILVFSLAFLILAVLDKPKGLGIVYFMGVFSILYCVLCIGTLTGFLQWIWPFSH